MSIHRARQARDLVQKIDDLLTFVEKAIGESDRGYFGGFTRADYEHFLELDRRVAALATQIDLPLPSMEKLSRSLDFSSIPKKTEFIGLTNLPGDWDNGSFLKCLGPWCDEMRGLRECAAQLASVGEVEAIRKTQPQPGGLERSITGEPTVAAPSDAHVDESEGAGVVGQSRKKWSFDDDPPDDSKFAGNGPIEGTLKTLSEWSGQRQKDLKEKNGGAWHIREIHRTKYAIWMSTRRAHAKLNKARIESQSASNDAK